MSGVAALLLLVVSQSPGAAPPSSLDRAQLKELSFLKTEKAAMERRVLEVERETERILGAARSDLAALEERVVEARGRAEALEERLQGVAPAAKEKLDAIYDSVARADELAAAARGSAADLPPHGAPEEGSVGSLPVDRAPTTEEVAAALESSFGVAARYLDETGGIRRAQGVFHDVTGERVEGQILRVGDVAAYGVSERVAGALAPAGQGHLELVPVPAAAEARQIAAGSWPASLPIYLADAFTEHVARGADSDLAREVEARAKANMKGHGLVDTLMRLPIFEAEWVLYLLMALSVVSVALMVERATFYRRHTVDVEVIRLRLKELLSRGDYAAAASYLSEFDSLETNVALFGLREHHQGPDSVEDLLRGAEARERLRYNRWLGFLATVGSNSPFIGLFGTVLGIIRAFADLAADAGGAAGGGSVMAGISEALIATAVGLLVAIPAVIAYNTFVGRVKVVLASSELLSRTVLSALKAHDAAPRGG